MRVLIHFRPPICRVAGRALTEHLAGWDLQVCGRDELREHMGGADVLVPMAARVDGQVIEAA